jgi:hypothetical protein
LPSASTAGNGLISVALPSATSERPLTADGAGLVLATACVPSASTAGGGLTTVALPSAGSAGLVGIGSATNTGKAGQGLTSPWVHCKAASGEALEEVLVQQEMEWLQLHICLLWLLLGWDLQHPPGCCQKYH